MYEKKWATLRRLRAQKKRVDACAPCLPDFLEVDLSLVLLFLSRGANEKAWFGSQLESLSPINWVSATIYEISKSSFDPHNQTPAFGMKESGIGVSHRSSYSYETRSFSLTETDIFSFRYNRKHRLITWI